MSSVFFVRFSHDQSYEVLKIWLQDWLRCVKSRNISKPRRKTERILKFSPDSSLFGKAYYKNLWTVRVWIFLQAAQVAVPDALGSPLHTRRLCCRQSTGMVRARKSSVVCWWSGWAWCRAWDPSSDVGSRRHVWPTCRQTHATISGGSIAGDGGDRSPPPHKRATKMFLNMWK